VTGSALPAAQVRALGAVLARAFAPSWWPGAALPALGFGCCLVLLAHQRRGVIAYLPGRAVAVLTPPRSRPWQAVSELARLGRTCWCLSNCAAWPTGEGAGTILLAEICELSDRASTDLCLRASGERSREFYRRAGFRPAPGGYRGMVMVRPHHPPVTPDGGPLPVHMLVLLAGRLAGQGPMWT
jgi:hypothetical protein